MRVKVVRQDGSSSEVFECHHYTVTQVSEEGVAVRLGLDVAGIRLELTNREKGKDTQTIATLQLPEDGEVAYIMNDGGDTIDSYRWPPKD
jgi:hypothetical protein